MKLKVRWEVEDGYVGKSRPQESNIDTEDLMDDEEWNDLSEEEKKEHVYSMVQEDFETRISFGIDDFGF